MRIVPFIPDRPIMDKILAHIGYRLDVLALPSICRRHPNPTGSIRITPCLSEEPLRHTRSPRRPSCVCPRPSRHAALTPTAAAMHF